MSTLEDLPPKGVDNPTCKYPRPIVNAQGAGAERETQARLGKDIRHNGQISFSHVQYGPFSRNAYYSNPLN